MITVEQTGENWIIYENGIQLAVMQTLEDAEIQCYVLGFERYTIIKSNPYCLVHVS